MVYRKKWYIEKNNFTVTQIINIKQVEVNDSIFRKNIKVNINIK